LPHPSLPTHGSVSLLSTKREEEEKKKKNIMAVRLLCDKCKLQLKHAPAAKKKNKTKKKKN